jgi:O-antigen/teichoic acid export membrane protein
VPTIISTIGGQLSVIVVLGYSGSVQAGEYYIASIVFSAVIAVPMAIINAAFPVQSAMNTPDHRITSRIIRIGLMLSAPLAVVIVLYSSDILELLNPHFENAVLPLSVFMIAVVPTVMNYGIYFMFYAFGKYRSVLIIGLAENLSKVVLYFVLVPEYGAIGAAISFVSGSLMALTVVSSTQGKLVIPWKRIGLLTVIPLLVGCLVYVLQFGPIVGIPLITAIVFYLYVKLAIITMIELREMTYGILPEVIADKVYPRMEYVVKLIGQKTIFDT